MDALKRERDDLIQKLNALKNDLLDLRNLEQKLIDSENKNSNLLNENNRLNAQLKKRGEELDSALLNLQKYESELQYVRVEAD